METAPATPAKKASVLEDLVDIYIAPSDVFRRRMDGKFGVALIVLLVATAVLFLLTRNSLQPIFDAEFQRGMDAAVRQNPQITPEQMEGMRKIGETMAPIIVLVTQAIAVFLVGFVLWLVGKLFGSSQPLQLAIMVATYSQFPRILQFVLNGIQGFVMDPGRMNSMFSISLSPARFLDPASTSPVVLALLGRLDLFTIWCTVLLAIGLHITGNLSKGTAFAAAAIVWLCGAVPPVMQAMQQG